MRSSNRWASLPFTSPTAQVETVYGFLGLVGGLTFAIIGMLLKIGPFLGWCSSYGIQIGRANVPSLVNFYYQRLQIVGFALLMLGLAGVAIRFAMGRDPFVQINCVFPLIGGGVFALNEGRILSHRIRPGLAPYNATHVPPEQ